MTKFSKDHEWITMDGDIGTVGITDYAQSALGDVVFVELPDVGANFTAHDEVAVVESVKAASEIYSPVGGEIVEVNELLQDAPETVNGSPMDDGWFYRIKVNDLSELDELMTEDEYASFVEDLD